MQAIPSGAWPIMKGPSSSFLKIRVQLLGGYAEQDSHRWLLDPTSLPSLPPLFGQHIPTLRSSLSMPGLVRLSG